jgi:hypothetical protein
MEEMKTNIYGFIALVLVLLTLGMLLEGSIRWIAGQTYKQGQIDYANGIIKYKLEKQKDNSIQWKRAVKE